MGIIASFVQTWHRVNQRFFLARRLKHPFVSQSQWSGPLPPNPRCPTDVPARCSPPLRCNPSKLLSGVMHFSEVQSTEEYSLVRHNSVEQCSGDVATLVSSKTRSESRLGLRGFTLAGAEPLLRRRVKPKCPAPLSPLSMGGEGHANLFCGSYPAWRTQSVNPLSPPGHKCARCNKDYGSRVFEEEEKDEMFDFSHVFQGGRGWGGSSLCL